MKAKILSLILTFSMLFPTLAQAAGGTTAAFGDIAADLSVSSSAEAIAPAAESAEQLRVLSLAESEIELQPLAASSDGLPELEQLLHSDNFDDNAYDPNYVTVADGGGSSEVADGKIKLTRSKSSGTTEIDLYATSDSAELRGTYYLEFEMSRSAGKKVLTRSMDGTGQWGRNITTIDWLADGTVQYQNGSAIINRPASSTPNKLKLGILMNSDTDLFAMWVDDEFVAKDISTRTADVSGFKYMRIYMEGSNYFTLELDSYALYKAKPIPMADDLMVEYDIGQLTEENILNAPLVEGTYLIDSLNLPSKGKRGSNINWVSTEPDIVASDGTVSRHLTDEKDVTITATVSSGDVSESTSFTFKVPPLKSSHASMPELMGILAKGDFEDDTYDAGMIVTNAPAGKAEAADGKLKLTRSKSSGNSYVEFLSKADKSEVGSKVYMEFLVSRASETNLFSRSYDSSDHCLTAIDWLGNGKVRYGNGGEDILTESTHTGSLKYAILTDPEANTYSLWLNNTLIASDLPTKADDVSGFKLMKFYLQGSDYSTISFDSYRIYKVWKDMPDADRVALDASELVYDSLLTADEVSPGVIDQSLKLPLFGSNGSSISWSSSDDMVISSDGKLTRPHGADVREVTLTAAVTYGSARQEKEFTFKIPEAGLDVEAQSTIKDLVCHYEFDNEEDGAAIGFDAKDITSTYKMEGGKYSVTRGGDYATTSLITINHARYGGDDNCLTGVVGVEFTLERDAAKPIQVQLKGVSGQNYFGFVWYGAGDVNVGVRDTISGEFYYSRTTKFYPDQLRVKVLFDTNRSMFTLWLNDDLTIYEKYSRDEAVTTYASTRIYCENDNYFTFTVDDFKVYYATPPTLSKLDYDMVMLTDKSILTAPYVVGNYIDSPLNLYTEMEFGSTIEWESDRPDVINPITGEVKRPLNTDYDIPVTLTANVTNVGGTRERSFDFVVLRELTTDEAKEQGDFDTLNETFLTSESPDAITQSLNLISKAAYGNSVSWTSSNDRYIAPSGKVTRPKWDEPDANVILTATVAGKYQKQFAFTVLADEKPTDPQRTTDADFFGVWNGSSWTTAPMLDYEYQGMQKVGEAAKNGDYTKAKEELFSHMKSRERKTLVGLGKRNTLWVDALVAGMADMQSAGYHGGRATVSSNEYEKITATITSHGITGPSSKSYAIISKYNDPTEVTIAGTAFSNEEMRPRLTLMVNDSPRTYIAKNAATVRTGDYMREPYGRNDELKVKMFGDFLGNETYRTYFEFDFSDLQITDVIGSAQLEFYAKKSTDYSEPKDLWILKDPNTGWDETTLCWNDLQTYVHNYSGIPGGKTWQKVLGSNVEYYYQTCRFYGYREMVREYLYTKNKDYAYAVVRDMMDFINDCKYVHPRTLDTGVRMEAWVGLFDYVMQLPYTDAEICTAIIKTMYQDMLGLNRSSADDNWAQTEKYYTYCAAVLFPELAADEEIKQFVVDYFTRAINIDYYPDGAYIEDTAGYNVGAISRYIEMKKKIEEIGGEVSEGYDSILHQDAYYNLLLRGPAGENLAYGDSAPGQGSTSQQYPDIAGWYNDYELLYIDTFGARGTEPSWTSKHFPHATYTFMRSDWTKTSSYLFTSVRGNMGAHGHSDDNAIILFGYGRNLLVDAGYVDYSGSEDRTAARSTKMHNTVTVNDKSQEGVVNYTIMYGNQGEVHNWTTNADCDFLSQTTTGYNHIGNSHRRSITFVKPGIWIVSDLLKPTDKTAINNYKQTWHMLPAANMTVDAEAGKLASGFASGGNIAIASADSDAQVKTDIGVYTSGYGNPVRPEYGYYEKNASGDASFDTVLYAYDGTKGTVGAERIALGVPTSEATALKFTTENGGEKIVSHYLLNYEPGGDMTFGKYTSNGMVTVVSEDASGNPIQIILNNGNKVTDSEGNVILETPTTLTDISVDITGGNISIVSSDTNLNPDNIKIATDLNVSSVTVNGEYKRYDVADGVIELTNEAGIGVIKNDNNANLGIKDKLESAGGSSEGSVGGSSGGIGGGAAVPSQPADNLPFADISDHWAKQNIVTSYFKGYINGYDDGTFRPNNSITRAEFTAIVCRALDVADAAYGEQFADVSADDWYAPYIGAALNAGIISYDANFRPNDTITREEMCKILAIALQNSGIAPPPQGYTTQFADNEAISEWAMEYVCFASYHGLMSGREDGSFAPKANATRAEAATVLSRVPVI